VSAVRVVSSGGVEPALPIASALTALALAVACGSSPPITPPDGGPPIAILGGDDAPGPDACPSLRCPAGSIAHACVCVSVPRTDPSFATTRTTCAELSSAGVTRTPVTDSCVEGGTTRTPDLACFGAGRRAPLPSREVTVHGVVDVFGNGTDSGDIVIEIYREGEGGELGELVGETTSDAADTVACAETEIEIASGEPTGETRRLGFYAIPGVPTEVPLIVVTRPSAGDEGLWKSLYTYNFQVLDDEVESGAPAPGACAETPTGDRYLYRARVLSVGDYRTIPLTASIPTGIPTGHGALAGEIHDCADVRLSFATVGVLPEARSLVYFSNDADNPLPDVNRVEGTSALGLYSALDLAPGPIDIAALGRLAGGEIVSLGWYRARIFEDSVTVVTLRGERPQQVRE
jgi:hypothetical protein